MEIEWQSQACGCYAGKQMMAKFIQMKKMYHNEQTSWSDLRAALEEKMMLFMEA